MPNFPKGVGKIKVSNMIVLLKVYVVSYANSEQKSGNDLFCSSKKSHSFLYFIKMKNQTKKR